MAATANDQCLEGFEDLSADKDRGILKKIIKEGSCDIKPCPGDTVVVHYVGTYFGGEQDGQQFDSSRDRNEKFEFTISKGDVIKAWDAGVATMKLGEICELIAAPEYAYNDEKSMKFVIELFDTKGTDVSLEKNGTVRKSTVEEGRDIFTPTVGLDGEISYRKFGDEKFSEVAYIVGDPAPNGIPECVDLAVRHMHTAEKCLVRLCPIDAQAADSAGDVTTDNMIYEVRLKSFEKVKYLSALSSFPEQMTYAEGLKSKANEYLKASKYNMAISLYKRLEDDLQYIIANEVPHQKTLTDVSTAILLNLALAYLKLGDSESCSEKCRKVLETNASNEKALFRLGQACLLKKDHEDAAVYFKRIVTNNPNNAAAVKQLKICQEVIQSVKERERKMFRGIFERFKETGLGDAGQMENGTLNGNEKCAT